MNICLGESNIPKKLATSNRTVARTVTSTNKDTFDPANISTSDQRCFNVVDQRWNNVDPTLKLKQRWFNFISTLFQLGLNNSKSCIKTSRASDKYRFAKSISKFYSAKCFEQYINNSTTNKLVNSYINFLTVHIRRKGENGEAQKSSKL